MSALRENNLAALHFKRIDESNEAAVRSVKLKSGQESFIETVDECLQEANEHPEWQPVAIYAGEEVVGFAMYGSFGSNKDTWIDRIMIDEKHQGKGYGRTAMEGLIVRVCEKYGVDTVYVSIIEENNLARRLYESMGFEEMDERDPNGEIILQKKCS